MESLELSTVVSNFLRCDPKEINSDTNISPAKIGGSILAARMYSELEKKGYTINHYWDIKTFGDLIKKIEGNISKSDNAENEKINNANNVNNTEHVELSNLENKYKNEDCIGIDLEFIENLPDADDYWNDEFYRSNFTNREIAYCTLKNNPKESFAGKIAAKESIIKLLNGSDKISFSDIEILNHLDGSPYYNDQITLSISHTKNYALAVAIYKHDQANRLKNKLTCLENETTIEDKKNTHNYVSLIILAISVIINILYFEHVL